MFRMNFSWLTSLDFLWWLKHTGNENNSRFYFICVSEQQLHHIICFVLHSVPQSSAATRPPLHYMRIVFIGRADLLSRMQNKISCSKYIVLFINLRTSYIFFKFISGFVVRISRLKCVKTAEIFFCRCFTLQQYVGCRTATRFSRTFVLSAGRGRPAPPGVGRSLESGYTHRLLYSFDGTLCLQISVPHWILQQIT